MARKKSDAAPSHGADASPNDAGAPLRRKKRDPQRMANVMPHLMAKRGYSRLLSHDDFSDAWLEVSGPLGQHSRTGRARRGVLEIIVGSSAVMQELNFGKRRLLKAMQAKLPDQKILDLKFSVKND